MKILSFLKALFDIAWINEMNIITITSGKDSFSGWTVTLTTGRNARPEQHSNICNAGDAAAKAVQIWQFLGGNVNIVGDDRAMALIPESIKNNSGKRS